MKQLDKDDFVLPMFESLNQRLISLESTLARGHHRQHHSEQG
jgi:hypothetical protein